MKIYTKLIVDIETDKVISSESYEDVGGVAEAKGAKPVRAQPAYSTASGIVGGELRAPLTDAIKSDIITNPFANAASAEYQATTDALRSGYGARGLANSGIAIKGEQQALGDIAMKAQAQRAGQLTGILGTASSSPTALGATPATPRGFMGLK